ncbi:MAG: HAD family hydrolase [Promethearchaeota archaeon]
MKKNALKNLPKAIIFDLDGTLIDSIPAHVRAYQKLANDEFGIHLEQESILKHFGKKSRDIIKALLPAYGKDLDALVKKKQSFYREAFNSVKLLLGVEKLLHAIKKKGIRRALGTSSSSRNVDFTLKKFDLEFDVVITGEDVERGKPSPDTFLKIAQRLNLSPKDCLVIGDSVYDIIAAKKAGMKAIGVLTGSTTREEMQKVKTDAIFENLLEFMEYAQLL